MYSEHLVKLKTDDEKINLIPDRLNVNFDQMALNYVPVTPKRRCEKCGNTFFRL